MTQLSRPFQIVLVTFGLFVLVWFVALHGHNQSAGGGPGSSSSGSSAPNATATPTAAAQAKSAGAPTHVYTGPVPGLHGLSRAIDKAHGAVAQSQTDARSFEHAEPSGTSSSTPATGASASAKSAAGASAATAAAASRSQAAASSTSASGQAKSVTSPGKSGGLTLPTKQPVVERELQQNKTVLILFWNPRGTEDVAVRKQLPIVAHKLGGTVAIHYNLPHEVTDYGKITNTVQVNQTPTILIVNTRGQTTTLTGLTDAFSIEQAVAEARKS
jgi:hypothetical protein